MEGKIPLSVCIVTYNEEANIRRCLESVSWADDIVVIDSLSKDKTVEICREFTDKIIERRWRGQIEQKSFALSCAKHEWVLLIDGDEVLSPSLSEELRKELVREEIEWDGFSFPRCVYYLGRWICHGEWYPDYKLRVFRKSKGRIGGVEPHDRVELVGKVRVKRLKQDLWHFTYTGISDQVGRLNDFSSISAEQMAESGKKSSILAVTLRPLVRFLTGYFLRCGFRDGMRGFVIAVISSFYVFLKYCKLWELRRIGRHR